MTMAEFASFLGWCTLINFVLLAVSTIVLVGWNRSIARIHARMFQLESADVYKSYFNYLANFKILVIVFNLVPYLALRFMGV